MAEETIVQLMAQAMASLRAVGKDSRFNGPGAFNFRGIDATMNAVGPVFRELGIVGPVPSLESIDYTPTGNKDKTGQRVCVRVTYRFFGPGGDCLECTVPGEAMDFGDKGAAKAMSVACRTALLQVLCLPTQEPDPDSFIEGRSEVELAREALTAKMTRLKLDPGAVLRLYGEQFDGADPRTDTDTMRIREFTDQLRRA